MFRGCPSCYLNNQTETTYTCNYFVEISPHLVIVELTLTPLLGLGAPYQEILCEKITESEVIILDLNKKGYNSAIVQYNVCQCSIHYLLKKHKLIVRKLLEFSQNR